MSEQGSRQGQYLELGRLFSCGPRGLGYSRRSPSQQLLQGAWDQPNVRAATELPQDQKGAPFSVTCCRKLKVTFICGLGSQSHSSIDNQKKKEKKAETPYML